VVEPAEEMWLRNVSELVSQDFIEAVIRVTPRSRVRSGLERSLRLQAGASAREASALLGSGDEVTAYYTVPFCVWCAASHLDDFESALWTTVSGLGDRDTTCAIVGGIVGGRVGLEAIPKTRFAAREPLPFWVYALGS